MAAPLLAALGALNLALAAWMTIAPRSFFDTVADFGAYNPHDLRDVATWYTAAGLGLLGAARWPSWRVPVLAVVAVQSALHLVNHLADAGRGATAAMAWFDVASLAATTAIFTWLLVAARRDEGTGRTGAARPAAGRIADGRAPRGGGASAAREAAR